MSQDLSITNDYIVKSMYSLLQEVDKSISSLNLSTVTEKKAANFVTNVDYEVEQRLVAELQVLDDMPCLAEESNRPVDCCDYWVIDPIDGTTNMIHGYPSYCISVAKVQNDVTVYGFVYNLVTKEFFIGVKGKGSYLLNLSTSKQIRLSVSNVCAINDSLIGFGCPYDKQKTDKLFQVSNKLLKECHDLKRNGPASLDICYVASGRYDAYYELDLQEWDYKAAKLILEEAGGKITNWCGEEVLKGMNNILASNGNMHDEMIKFLN